MPTNKDLKRIVRQRMKKTGESYTAARLRVVGRPAPDPATFAELAGMSDDAVEAKTGRTWRQWVEALDAVDAPRMSHREIARHVGENFDVSGWWAQSVTVGYERIRGLRDVRQRRGGSYDANKSKTFYVPVARLYRAFSEKHQRERWLIDVDPTVRTSKKNTSVRFTWPDDTRVQAYFTEKSPGKSQVAIQHGGLADQAAVTEAKATWAERLGALQEFLAEGTSKR